MKETQLSIQTVIVLPRNKYYCSYILNDGSKHTKKYDDMKSFLIGLVPSKSREIRDLIDRFRYFILYVSDQDVEEFEFDFDLERELLKQTNFQKQISNPGVALKHVTTSTSKTFFERIDEFFEKRTKK